MQIASVETIQDDRCFIELYRDPFNKRLRIDDYRGDVNTIIEKVEALSILPVTEKIIFKARYEHMAIFFEHGYVLEGKIQHYFCGSDAWFFCKYLVNDRKNSLHWQKEDDMVKSIQKMSVLENMNPLLSQYELRKLTQHDASELATLYQTVFQIYPTPLNDQDYVKKTMEDGTIYYGCLSNGKLVSAASAEVNHFYKNAELTDCATVVEHRKFGLMKYLLCSLEMELKNNGVFCIYSLARALSFGMNAVLHQLGYKFQGRLTNNCYIYDKLEDMNVWVKEN